MNMYPPLLKLEGPSGHQPPAAASRPPRRAEPLPLDHRLRKTLLSLCARMKTIDGGGIHVWFGSALRHLRTPPNTWTSWRYSILAGFSNIFL
jgi:hypothetical protein